MAKSLKVTKKQHEQRLDLFLAEQLSVSRKKVKALIDQGRIWAGEKKIIIASWKLQEGDTVEVRDKDDGALPRRKRYLKIWYEDEYLLVVEKPPGVACERTGQTLTSTVVDDLNDYLRRAHPGKPYPYIGLMHRLDRETSGLMVYSLSKQANRLARDFRFHQIERKYLAIVEGAMKSSEGRINRPLQKDLRRGGRKMKTAAVSLPTGRPAVRAGRQGDLTAQRAVTDFIVKQRFPQATLVEARLLTGRTHQVRVHFASLGHPVMGDKLYGGRAQVPRQMLHASHLEFEHPVTKKKLRFTSPLPKDFKSLLDGWQRAT
jgi:23S rRNA pseudouridine1911/1915/1917 synthase